MDQQVWTHVKSLNELVPAGKKHLVLGNWQLSGDSKSALRTGFKMGPFHLDAGHSVFGNWDVLLISHGHADHIFSVASFFLVGSAILDGSQTVMAPQTSMIRRIADSTMQCNYDSTNFHVSANFIDAIPDHTYNVTLGRDQYRVHILKMDHRVPTVGYCVSKLTKRLNPILLPYKDRKDFPSMMKDIRAGKSDLLQPDVITTEHWLPQFCFLTDTSIKAIVDNIAVISEYPIIIVECTFYDKDDVEHATETTHIHWFHILPFIKTYEDSLWVLIHSSRRHKNKEDILNTIDGDIPSNCFIWN